MSKILAGNVFITKSRNVMDKLFFSDSKIESFTERYSLFKDDDLKNSFVASPVRNEGLLHFDYTFSSKKNITVNIRLLENSRMVEFLLLQNDPMARKLSDVFNKFSNEPTETTNTSATGSVVTRYNVNEQGQITGYYQEQEATIYTETTWTYGTTPQEAQDALLQTSIDDSDYRLKVSDQFYFAFGAGDNISDWSGPYSMQLAGARLVVGEDNVRVLEATFVPNTASLRFWNNKFDDIMGFERATNKFNQYLSRQTYTRDYAMKEFEIYMPKSLIEKQYKERPTSLGLAQAVAKVVNDQVRDYFSNDNMVGIIKNLFRDYLSNLCNGGESIVVLPQITKLKVDFEDVDYEDSRVVRLTGGPTRGGPGVLLGRWLGTTLKSINSYFKNLGIKFTVEYRIVDDAGNVDDGTWTNPYNGVKGILVNIRRLDRIRSVVLRAEMSVTNVASQGNESSSPILEPLYKFYASLKDKVVEGNPAPYEFFEETNYKLVSLWEDFGIIKTKNDKKSVAVFGDRNEIKKLLYLDGYDVEKEEWIGNKPSDSSITTVFGDALDGGTDPGFGRYNRYIKEFTEIFLHKERRSRSSSFGEDIGVDDPIILQNIKTKLNNPKGLVFRHNVKNPNVLNLTYQMDNYVAALTGFRVYPRLDNYIIGSSKFPLVKNKILESLGNDFVTDLNKKIDSKLKSADIISKDDSVIARTIALLQKDTTDLILDKLSEDKSITSVKNIQDFTMISLSNMLEFIRNYDTFVSNRQADTTLVTEPENYSTAYAGLFHKFETLLVNIKLKTLPFFNQTYYIDKSCQLLGFNNSVIGSLNSTPKIAPYTGNYNIIGFSHVINTEEMYSTFELVRSSFHNNNIETDITVKQFLLKNIEDRIADLKRLVPKLESQVTNLRRILGTDEDGDSGAFGFGRGRRQSTSEQAARVRRQRLEELDDLERIYYPSRKRLEQYTKLRDNLIGEDG